MQDVADMTAGKAPERRRLQIFREAGAETLQDAAIMKNDSSPAAVAHLVELGAAGLGSSYLVRCLFGSGQAEGLSLIRAWFKGNHLLPPHTHDTDCLYYITAGSIRLGEETLRDGDGFFIPANTVYSYQAGEEGVEILEFRERSHFNIVVKEGTSRGWARMQDICVENEALWADQEPPRPRPRNAAGEIVG